MGGEVGVPEAPEQLWGRSSPEGEDVSLFQVASWTPSSVLSEVLSRLESSWSLLLVGQSFTEAMPSGAGPREALPGI